MVKTYLACDFCGKSTETVEKMIRGIGNAAICNFCVDLAQDICTGKAEVKPETKDTNE